MKVLVIAPHMDDEVLGMGGTIMRHCQNGDHVTVVFVANRVYDHKFDQQAYDAEKDAALNAQKILGYQAIEFLGLNDEKLDGHVQDILIPLEEVWLKTKPDVLYSCFYGDNNQDHRAVFSAMRVIARPWSQHPVGKVFLYEVPSSTDQSPPIPAESFLPNYYVNVESTIKDKLNALACYEREVRELPHPRSKEGVSIYAQKRGMECGFKFAESFMQIRNIWA